MLTIDELYKTHFSYYLSIAFRIVKDKERAEDVVQDSFAAAFLKIKTLKNKEKIKSWIASIVVNKAKNSLRKKFFEPLDVLMEEFVECEPDIDKTRLVDKLCCLVNLLPDRQRKAVIFRDFLGMSFKEVADKMNCCYDTAKANYRHGRLKILERVNGFFVAQR